MPGKLRPCWDVRFVIDGRRYFRRFDRAGDADAYVAQLRRGEASGWLFDPEGRRFVDPAVARSATARDGSSDEDAPIAQERPETVFTWTERYWRRKWPTLEPRGRSELARYLNRARRGLVDAEPEGATAADVSAYLSAASLTVADEGALALDAQRGETWLQEHSLPMASVGRRELEALVER